MKFSIITITYNRAHLIGETIQSVVDQTYTDFEYIIIDDGSTDDTEKVVKKFKDERIHYYRNEKIGNLNTLRNKGIKKSNGEIIALLDSDDIWANNKLEVLEILFKSNEEIKFVTHDISYFNSIDQPMEPYYSFKHDFFEKSTSKVLLFEILPFPNFAFKREVITTVGLLNESLYEGLQDYLFRVSCRYKLYFLPKSLTFMRIHNSNIHKSSGSYRYFIDYYRSVFSLLLKKQITFGLFIKGSFLNSKNFIKYLLKK